ncbi:GTPase Era [Sulfurospirillum arcachonense]|uniref:GTPase Era n=1 Tax=Sulfurospirillum arcachonense TaxID=57666 RepID=UPI0004B97DC6|nr:GTPase Era [Sulfurospirillum arcachonense]
MDKIDTKAGFVSVIGRPNAGKSSLLNWLIGEKIAMVSHKANATRKRSNIIAMHKNAQIIFVDTPGIHEKERLLNKFMMDEALKAMGDCDLILFLAPASDNLKDYEKFLERNSKNIPHILLLTKVDNINKQTLFKKIEEYSQYQDKFTALIPVSIKKGISQSYLLDEISKELPIHPFLYDTEILTTDPVKDLYKEYIREAIFNNTSEEIPYFADVLVEKVEENDEIDNIYATIIVDKKSQKGIVIGKEGRTLQRIGFEARKSIEKLMGKKIFLKLFVVVKQGWSQDKDLLKKIGYIVE